MENTRGGIPVALGLALLAAACAGGPAPVPPKLAAAAPRADDEWTAMSWEDRHDTMTWLVLPAMGRLLQAHDEKRWPDLTCRTCHGADAEEVHYKMPHGLPPLDPAHMPDPKSPVAKEARTAKFMAEEVVPRMREMLGAPQLSCFTCHPRSR
jgi:hypothetical protein